MEFKYFRPRKSWNLIVSHGKLVCLCVVCKLLEMSKQGQNKIWASYVRKYPKTRMILTIFETGSSTLDHRKWQKVMEFEKLKSAPCLFSVWLVTSPKFFFPLGQDLPESSQKCLEKVCLWKTDVSNLNSNFKWCLKCEYEGVIQVKLKVG